MKGWKTWAAGIGTILVGIGQLVQAVTGAGDADFNGGFQTILAGLAVLGIGHKIEKSTS